VWEQWEDEILKNWIREFIPRHEALIFGASPIKAFSVGTDEWLNENMMPQVELVLGKYVQGAAIKIELAFVLIEHLA
jgi:hypothetical protein